MGPHVTRKPRQQPHTLPHQVRLRKKRYLVTGPQRVGEVSKGGIVELALTEDQERALFEGGHIAPAPAPQPVSPPSPPVEKPADKEEGQKVSQRRGLLRAQDREQ